MVLNDLQTRGNITMHIVFSQTQFRRLSILPSREGIYRRKEQIATIAAGISRMNFSNSSQQVMMPANLNVRYDRGQNTDRIYLTTNGSDDGPPESLHVTASGRIKQDFDLVAKSDGLAYILRPTGRTKKGWIYGWNTSSTSKYTTEICYLSLKTIENFLHHSKGCSIPISWQTEHVQLKKSEVRQLALSVGDLFEIKP